MDSARLATALSVRTTRRAPALVALAATATAVGLFVTWSSDVEWRGF
ncbi:MAG: hypothetical protein ACLP9C_05900 [Acidimicrobiales bacterium]